MATMDLEDLAEEGDLARDSAELAALMGGDDVGEAMDLIALLRHNLQASHALLHITTHTDILDLWASSLSCSSLIARL
jgi:hypothetical protein